jgi:hypothetical protein
MFGVGRPRPLDRNAKVRIMHWTRCLSGSVRLGPLILLGEKLIAPRSVPRRWPGSAVRSRKKLASPLRTGIIVFVAAQAVMRRHENSRLADGALPVTAGAIPEAPQMAAPR